MNFSTRLLIYILFLFLLINCRCQNNIQSATGINKGSLLVENSKIFYMPSDSLDSTYNGLMNRTSIFGFYRTRGFKPAWMDGNKLSLLGDSMRSIIKDIGYYGLRPEDYHYMEIEAKNDTYSSAKQLYVDAMLSDAFIMIARDLKHGRDGGKNSDANDSIRISLLQSVVGGCSVAKELESQEPQTHAYRNLKHALKGMLDTLRSNDKLGNLPDSLVRKIEKISINLDRWRREPKPFGQRYILINIPAFTLKVISDEKVVLESKIIVGKPDTPTPTLSSVIECFIIYPYWHVPRKIAVEEYLPIIRKDVSFIRRSNFDVLNRLGTVLNADSVNWKKFNKNYFPVTLRQREGADNSLGVIKFVFENPYAVYLHDTNAKRLFKHEVRAFSHGCVRLEKAVALAHYLQTEDINRKSKIITNYLKQKQRHTVDISKPIPIYIRYFTCDIIDNVFYEYNDIYNMDTTMSVAYR